MSVRKYITEQENKIKLIGGIIATLNRVENSVVHIISLALVSINSTNQERGILINDIINDDKIFCKFEEKRLMLRKVVKRVAFVIKDKKINIKFDEKKYLDFCERIKKVQEIRNKIAHNYLCFSQEGLAIYYKRKSEGQLLEEKGFKKGSLKKFSLNLEEILEESIKICDEGELILGELIPKIINVLDYDPNDKAEIITEIIGE